jgi:hypothetical protein
MIKACYNCKNYRATQRLAAKKNLWEERCAAKGNARLEVPAVVAGVPIGLVSVDKYRNLIKANRSTYLFGSPAQYYDEEGQQNCAQYSMKEKS